MILLTGGSGFLGKHLVTALNDSNRKFISIGRNNADKIADLGKTIPQLPTNIKTVIHAAGKAHSVPRTEKEGLEFYRVNVGGTKNLLKALEASSIPENFIFISSVAVYGLSIGKLINEETPLSATDPYGLSKIQSERIIQDWCKSRGVICTIFRLPLIAGVKPPGNLGAMIKAIGAGYFFTIDGGVARKSMVLAADIAGMISKTSQVAGTFNLTDGHHPSFSELSQLIALKLAKRKPWDMPLSLATLLAKAGDLIGSKAPINSSKLGKIISDLTFDDSKARKILGWNPTGVLRGLEI